jgi:5'-nucleotidase
MPALPDNELVEGESLTYTPTNYSSTRVPDIRLLHYNDVYHVDPSSSEPVGGYARFQTLCDEYRTGEKWKGHPELVTVFSGDAFNPSLESSVTKGAHMVTVLNAVGTDVACVGVSLQSTRNDTDYEEPRLGLWRQAVPLAH